MAQSIKIAAETLFSYLESKGFTKATCGREVVYFKRSQRNLSVMLKVYTSVSVGASATRATGNDAIRVCVVYDSGAKSFGVGKFPPIFRVTSWESVRERIESRLMDAVKRGHEWMDQGDARTAAWEEKVA